jgi:hypothetical protein
VKQPPGFESVEFPHRVYAEKGVVWAETSSPCLVWPLEGVLV